MCHVQEKWRKRMGSPAGKPRLVKARVRHPRLSLSQFTLPVFEGGVRHFEWAATTHQRSYFCHMDRSIEVYGSFEVDGSFEVGERWTGEGCKKCLKRERRGRGSG